MALGSLGLLVVRPYLGMLLVWTSKYLLISPSLRLSPFTDGISAFTWRLIQILAYASCLPVHVGLVVYAANVEQSLGVLSVQFNEMNQRQKRIQSILKLDLQFSLSTVILGQFTQDTPQLQLFLSLLGLVICVLYTFLGVQINIRYGFVVSVMHLLCRGERANDSFNIF